MAIELDVEVAELGQLTQHAQRIVAVHEQLRIRTESDAPAMRQPPACRARRPSRQRASTTGSGDRRRRRG